MEHAVVGVIHVARIACGAGLACDTRLVRGAGLVRGVCGSRLACGACGKFVGRRFDFGTGGPPRQFKVEYGRHHEVPDWLHFVIGVVICQRSTFIVEWLTRAVDLDQPGAQVRSPGLFAVGQRLR